MHLFPLVWFSYVSGTNEHVYSMFWGIYIALVYGVLYLCFVAYPIVFSEGRGWSPGIAGRSPCTDLQPTLLTDHPLQVSGSLASASAP